MAHIETVLRFRIVRHEELPEAHQQAMRERGINPDEQWSLIWSFNDLADAEEQLEREQEEAASWQTFKIIDGGETEHREVEDWF